MNINWSILKSSLIKDTFIYTATDAIGKAISFILLPFVSYFLPPNELGIATNFSVLTSIVILIAGLALVNSLPYFYYERTHEENKTLVSNLLILSFSICIILLISICIFNSFIYKCLKLNFQYQLLSVLYVFCSLVCNTDLLLFRLEEKPKSFALYQIIQIVLNCIMVVLFVIVLRGGGYGKIMSDISVIFIMFVFHIVLMIRRKYIRIKISLSCMKTLLKFGLPLLPHSLSFWLKGGMDKVFITTYCGLYQNGLYSMALSISSLYSVVSTAFFNAYTPYLQKRLVNITEENEMQEKRSIVRITYILIAAFFIVGLLSVFGAWFIIYFIINKKYIPSFQYIPWIILGSYIYAFYNFFIEFIYKVKKTLIMGIITFTGSVIQMLLSYYLVKKLGALGAAYSTVIGAVIISLFIFLYSNKVYKMPWLSFVKDKLKR